MPEAAAQLFRAISTWRHVAHIKLANLSFPEEHAVDTGSRIAMGTAPLISSLPSLRTLVLGQTVFLPPSVIAAMICPLIPGQEAMNALELVHLVDAYRGSIWGPRIRRSDIERATSTLVRAHCLAEDAEYVETEMILRVRRIVRCEALTERLMGGDRVEGMAILE